MKLNEFGTIAYNEWMKTPKLRPQIELGAFIIMPNHIHGIIQILGRGELHSPYSPETNELHSSETNELNSPETNKLNSPENNIKGECNSPYSPEIDMRGEYNSPLRSPSQTVGAIVRGYKSSVTKQLKCLGFDEKLWQRNYYEHIIRNEQSFQTISAYIINNPAKWTDDKFYIQ